MVWWNLRRHISKIWGLESCCGQFWWFAHSWHCRGIFELLDRGCSISWSKYKRCCKRPSVEQWRLWRCGRRCRRRGLFAPILEEQILLASWRFLISRLIRNSWLCYVIRLGLFYLMLLEYITLDIHSQIRMMTTTTTTTTTTILYSWCSFWLRLRFWYWCWWSR